MNGTSGSAGQRKGLGSGIAMGAAIGGILGAIIGTIADFWILPVLEPLFKAIPLDYTLSGALMGVALGGLFGGLARAGMDTTQGNDSGDGGVGTEMRLREEVLDIKKETRPLSEVSAHKEVTTTVEHIAVPVTKEVLVIERNDPGQGGGDGSGTIRIPLREERVDIHKHPVTLSEVSITKHTYTDTEKVDETLKKERVKVRKIGAPKVRDDNGKQ